MNEGSQFPYKTSCTSLVEKKRSPGSMGDVPLLKKARDRLLSPSIGPSFNSPFSDYTSYDRKTFFVTKAPFALVDEAIRSVADWDLAR